MVPEVIETHTTYRFIPLLSHQFPLDRDATARVEETGEIYVQSHQGSVTLWLVNVFQYWIMDLSVHLHRTSNYFQILLLKTMY